MDYEKYEDLFQKRLLNPIEVQVILEHIIKKEKIPYAYCSGKV